MDQNEEIRRIEEIEDLLKLTAIEGEKRGKMEISLNDSIKLGFGLAFGFWIFHILLLMFLLLLTLFLEIPLPFQQFTGI